MACEQTEAAVNAGPGCAHSRGHFVHSQEGQSQKDHPREARPSFSLRWEVGGKAYLMPAKGAEAACAREEQKPECPLCDPGTWHGGPIQDGSGELPIRVPGHWTMVVELVTLNIPEAGWTAGEGGSACIVWAGLQSRA